MNGSNDSAAGAASAIITTTTTTTTTPPAICQHQQRLKDNKNDEAQPAAAATAAATTTTTTTAAEVEYDDHDDEDHNDHDDGNDGHRRWGRLVDITSLLDECVSSSLTYANPYMCNINSFSLHDAMTATQLMDRKMDCCEISIAQAVPHGDGLLLLLEANNNSNNNSSSGSGKGNIINGKNDRNDHHHHVVFPRPIPTGLDDPFVSLPAWSDLTCHDAALISVGILVRLQSFLSGASVGESIFTCLYAHATIMSDMVNRLFIEPVAAAAGAATTTTTTTNLPQQFELLFRENHSNERHNGDDNHDNDDATIAQAAIFASSLALIDTTEVVRAIVMNADIYEEEDFVSTTHEIPFYTDRGQLDTQEVLSDAIRLARKKTERTVKDNDDDVQILQLVIGFQSDFLAVCSSLAKSTAATIHNTVEMAKTLCRKAKNKLEQLSDLLSQQQHQQPLDERSRYLVRRTFDSYINRPYVGNAPVRKVSFLEPIESIQVLINISSELEWAVCNLLLEGVTLGRIQRMLDRVNRSSINILSRSLIVLNLYFDELLLGQYSLRKLISEHMKQISSIPDACIELDNSQAFFMRLAKPIYDYLKLRVLNRSRERTYIETVMLSDWNSLQSEANLLDAHCRQELSLDASAPPYFSHYVLSVLARLIDRHISCGIEMGLFYGYHELPFAFWYRDFVLSSLLNTLLAMSKNKMGGASFQSTNATLHQSASSPSSVSSGGGNRGGPGSGGGAGGGKGGRGKRKSITKGKTKVIKGPAQRTAEDMEEELEVNLITLKRSLCRGTVRFLAALKQAGVITEPKFDFTSLERIFERRFEPFQAIRQPPPLTYTLYQEGTDFSRVTASDLIRTTVDFFHTCKATTERILSDDLLKINPLYTSIDESEARALIRLCVGNAVYVQKLGQLLQDTNQQVSVRFDFGTHRQFCTIKLTTTTTSIATIATGRKEA